MEVRVLCFPVFTLRYRDGPVVLSALNSIEGNQTPESEVIILLFDQLQPLTALMYIKSYHQCEKYLTK